MALSGIIWCPHDTEQFDFLLEKAAWPTQASATPPFTSHARDWTMRFASQPQWCTSGMSSETLWLHCKAVVCSNKWIKQWYIRIPQHPLYRIGGSYQHGAIFEHLAGFCLFSLQMAQTIVTDPLVHWQSPFLISSGCKVSMTIEENNQNKQGGRKLKTVDYCLQYGNCMYFCVIMIIVFI